MKNFPTFLFLCFATTFVSAQPIFMKNYVAARSASHSIGIHTIIPLAGNKLLYISNSNQMGNNRMMVATTDASGTMQSGFHHGMENGELTTYHSVMAPDSMIYTTGSFKHMPGTISYYLYLNKMTPQGVIVWERNYSVTGALNTLTAGYDLAILPDTSIVVGGITGSPKRNLLIRIDKNGNVLWEKEFTGASDSWITGVAYHPSGDLLISGIDSSNTNNQPKAYVARVTTAGSIVWSKKGVLYYVQSTSLEPDVIPTTDGNLVFSYASPSNGSTNIAKLDYGTGNTIWMNGYGGFYAHTLICTPTGDIIAGGVSSIRPFLLRINSSGTFQNFKNFTGTITNPKPLRNFIFHPDGTIIANSEANVIKFKTQLITCTGTAGSITPAALSLMANVTLTPYVNTLNAPTVFSAYRTGAWWTMSTECGGKCNIIDNFAVGINATDQEYCRGKKVTFTSTEVNVASRQWSINGTPYSSSGSFTRQFNIPGTHTIQLTAQDALNCKDTATTYLKITNCGAIIQPPPVTSNTIGTFTNTNEVERIALIPTGGMVMANQHNNGTMVTLARFDSSITLVWAKKYSSLLPYTAKGMFRTQDNGYVMYATYNNAHVMLLKVDVNGNYIWHNHFRPVGINSGQTFLEDAIELPDGSIIVGGGSQSGPGGSGVGYAFMIKVSSIGSGVWEKNYSFSATQASLFTMFSVVNGNLWVGGSAGTTTGAVLGKVNQADGTFLLLNKIPTMYQVFDLSPTLDNKMVMMATGSGGGGYLAKIDGDDKLMWDAVIGAQYASKIITTSDSGFIIPVTATTSGGYRVSKVDKYGAVKSGFVSSNSRRSNIVKDANGLCWYASGDYTVYLERFHAEIEMVACTTNAPDVQGIRTGNYFTPITPLATDVFMLEDLQALNQSTDFRSGSQSCTRPGCLTNASFLVNMNACPGSAASFTNESLLGVSYIWKINGATVSTSTNLNYTFPGGGSYSVKLFATGANGCVDSLTQTMTIPALVVPVASSNTPVLTLGTINLTVTSTPGATYAWTGPNSFTSTTQNPSITNAMPIMTGMYYVTATSGYCTAIDSEFVTVSSNVSTTGTILSPLADSVRTVNLNLSGPTSANIVTGNNGTYSFLNLQPNGNYTVTPSKNNDVNKTNGVSTLDIVLIRRHILVADTLNTPYKILAADANNSGTVSSLDLIFIRSLILGTDTTFPGNRLWSFVPSSTTFPDPVNPWNPSAPPNSLSYINMGGAQTGQNFIGMKLGDVNNSWSPLIAKAKSVGELHLNFSDVTAKPGELISIPVSVGKFNQIAGLQATINWDKSILQFVEAEDAKLNCHFGKHKVNEGMLSFSWNEESGKTLSLEDGSPAMILTFKVIGKMGESTELTISDAITEAEAYNSNLDLLEIKSSSGKVKISDNPIKQAAENFFLVFPNPNSGKFTITFSDPGPHEIVVLIYNPLGQEIVNSTFASIGSSFSKEIDISAFGKGVYTLVAWNREKQLAWKIRVDN